jgi:TrmH family RNA methyltransferase
MSKLVINSNENSFFKNLKKIYSNKRYRSNSKKTILDGPHLIQTYLDSGYEVVNFITDESVHTSEIDLIIKKSPSATTISLSHELFCKISGLNSITGLMALINIPNLGSYQHEVGLHLLLNDIQDPGNLGAILRSHYAAGNNVAFLSKGSCDLWAPKTIRGSQGAQFFLKCFEHQDLEALIESFDFPSYSLSMTGESIFTHKFDRDIAVILGNEGQGINKILEQKAHKSLSIPMAKNIESLNVAAAASIVMYEYFRQLQLK